MELKTSTGTGNDTANMANLVLVIKYYTLSTDAALSLMQMQHQHRI
jgi:hypothetical protein